MPLLLILLASPFLWADVSTRYWISDTITRPYYVPKQDPNYIIYQKGFFVAQAEENELILTFYDLKKMQDYELSATIELELRNGGCFLTDIDVNQSWDEESIKEASIVCGNNIHFNDATLLPVLPKTPEEQRLNVLLHPDNLIEKTVIKAISYIPLLLLGLAVVVLVI